MDKAEVFALLDRIAAKDEAAFRQLYRACSRKLYAYVVNQVRDAGKAEEIVADTMYEIWRQPHRFRGESQFGTWLIGIARNKMLLAFRSEKAHRNHEDIDALDEQLESEDLGVFERCADQQRREGVRRCLDKLPEAQRECMHLMFYEDCSVSEVAALQSCPEGTVKTRLFNARQRLRTCLRLLLEREGEVAGKE